jgi:hypothetical protein
MCFGLAKEWPEKVTKEKLQSVARHEVLELLMQPIWHMVLERELDFKRAEAERHRVVRRLENIFDFCNVKP